MELIPTQVMMIFKGFHKVNLHQMWLLDEHTFLTCLWLRGVGENWKEMNQMKWRSLLLLLLNACNGGRFLEMVKFRTIEAHQTLQWLWRCGEPHAAEIWSGSGLGLKFALKVEVEAVCELLIDWVLCGQGEGVRT